MVLGFLDGIVGSTYGANEAQHRDRVDLEIIQSLNQTFGRSVDFHHALLIFPGSSPTMKITIRANHCSNIFGVSNNLHFTKLFAILREPGPQRIMVFVAILNPAALTKIQVEASNAVDTLCRLQSTFERMMKQQRDRQRKRTVQVRDN